MWFAAILYCVILFLLCVCIYKYTTYRPPNFPPGPIRLPIWGSYPFLLLRNWNFPQDQFHRWGKRYGNVIGFYAGPFPVVVTCDYEMSKEVLVRPEFDGRPDMLTVRARSVNEKILGIFFTDGPFWHEQRRFSLRHLRDYGFGRRFDKLESLMNDQLEALVEFMRYPKPCEADKDILKDSYFYFPDIFFPTMLNSIMSMFGMEIAEPGTDRYRKMREVGRAVLLLQHSLFPLTVVNMTPWMRYFVKNISGLAGIKESNNVLFTYFKDVIEHNRKTKLSDEDYRNFYDEYLNRIEKIDETETFSDDQLLMVTIDYMFPAVTAVPVTIKQLMFRMFNHPDVQEKMQTEIDEVVGKGRLPTLDDRQHMPYTEAVIREVMRKDTLVPLGLPHRTLEDTTLGGYDIPMNTLLFTSITGAHHDPKIWGDPEIFRPERFLDSKGNLLRKDYSIPFGAGKRLCAGETFARNSLFLLTAAIYQNFSFELPPGSKMPDLNNKIPGVINDQKDECWVKAKPRE